MRNYLDASFLVALLGDDVLSSRAEGIWTRLPVVAIVSDFASAEVASVMARRVRTGEVWPGEARTAFAKLDAWIDGAERLQTRSADIQAAEMLIRRLDLPLRTPDALNIALAQRAAAALATFDRQMAASGRRLGLEVVD